MIRRVLKVIGLVLLGLLLILPLYEIAAARLASRSFPAPGRMVDIGTHRLHVMCTGSGSPTVIFEAGAGTNSLYWSTVQPAIAKRTRTCSYDRAGFGWSEGGPTPRTTARVAAELQMLLRKADIEPPYVFVAHSMGGAISMEYASEHPDDVAGMVFVDAAYKELYETYLDQVPSFQGQLKWGKLAMRAAAVSAVFGLPRLIPIHAGTKKMQPDARAAADALAVRPRFLNAMRAEMEGLEASRTTALSDPPRDIPVAVLSHTEPKLFAKNPKAEGLWLPLQRKLADRFEDATFSRVEGAGHFIQLDRPDAVISAIERVLDSVDRR